MRPLLASFDAGAVASQDVALPSLPLLIVGAFFLLLAGLLSAVEISLTQLSRAYVEDLVEEGVKRAPRLARILEERGRAVVSLHGARVVALTIAILSTALGALDLLQSAGFPWWLVALIVLGVMAAVELLVVLVLPWVLVSRSYVGVALAGSSTTEFLMRLSRLFDPLVQRTSAKASVNPRLNVAADLRELADQVGESDGFDDEDKEIVRSVFEMNQTRVREVMVPRTSMVVVDGDETTAEALRVFVRSGFSRIPVFGGDVDDVIGTLYFKDIVRRLMDNGELAQTPVRSFVRPATFVPETRFVDDELREMQEGNTHLALVVDEYGGIAGLVTFEDLLEELVGEVVDEHDRAEMEPEQLAPGKWRVPARYSLNDLEELIDIGIDEESVDSVGGLLAHAINRVPLAGDTATVGVLELEAGGAVGRRNEVGSVIVTVLADRGGAGEEDLVHD